PSALARVPRRPVAHRGLGSDVPPDRRRARRHGSGAGLLRRQARLQAGRVHTAAAARGGPRRARGPRGPRRLTRAQPATSGASRSRWVSSNGSERPARRSKRTIVTSPRAYTAAPSSAESRISEAIVSELRPSRVIRETTW